MAKEIEKKFLVKGQIFKTLATGIFYKQGYISDESARSVRVRIADQKATLTIKGKSVGAVRDEFEYEIPLDDANKLLQNIAKQPIIEKTRYKIPYNGFVWEVDEFYGENQGLVLAEIELEHENQEFEIPEWIGKEVTHDNRYFNSNLFKNPYSKWIKP